MARLHVILCSVASIVACSSPAVVPRDDAPLDVPVALDPTAVSPAPSAGAAPVPSASPAAGGDAPRRSRASGSTRMTVACGSSRCSLPAQSCVFDQAASDWRCAASAYDPANAESPAVGYVCDDGLDCPRGLTCCARFARLDEDELSYCVPRAQVNSVCRVELCADGGALCPNGQTCVTHEGGAQTCEPPKGPATCGGKRRCPEDKPICALAAGGPTCVAEGTPEYLAVKGGDRYQCTRASDCSGGDQCSYAFGEIEHEVGTYCSKYSMMFMGTAVCDPAGPSLCGADAECRKAFHCLPGPKDLPWMGTWVSR